jgi:hypothetical protein
MILFNRKVGGTLLAALLVAGPSACSRGGGPAILGGGSRLPSDALDDALGRAVGDPTTCVLVANRADRKILYRYGEGFNCERGLPACDRPGVLSAEQALSLANATPEGRFASCNSNAAGDRTVGWAAGPVSSAHKRDLIYSAVMEGERTLPGREIGARVAEAFRNAGL